MDARGILEHLCAHGTTAPGIAVRIDVGTGAYMRYLEEEILDGLVERGGATVRLYEGEYGGGKTHLLQLVEETAIARGSAVVRADLSAELHLSDWRGLMRHTLSEMQVVTEEGQLARGLPAVLASREWDPDLDARLKNLRVPHAGFRDAMRWYAFSRPSGQAGNTLRKFLLGDQVPISMLKTAGIKGVKGGVTARNAERVLQTVALTLNALGVPALVLLLDETENVLSKAGRKAILAANILRRIVDGCTAGRLSHTFVGLAILPGTLEQAALHYPALGQRLQVQERVGGGFRRPVLEIARLNACDSPDDFLDEAIERIVELSSELGYASTQLQAEMRTAGERVLGAYASGYRRPLMKELSLLALRGIE